MESEFDIVRTYDEFVSYITENGLPSYISFDNDLGLDKNGKTFYVQSKRNYDF